MAEYSIAEAKNKFTKLVQRAEQGEAVRITRRGKPVAVLVSERAYARKQGKRRSYFDFLDEWHAENKRLGITFTGHEFDNIRDKTPWEPRFKFD